MKVKNDNAFNVITEQFNRELGAVEELVNELKIPVSVSELLKYSGLIVGEYEVKGKYRYYKLMGVLTGDKTDREERWLMKRENETSLRKRRIKRKTEHLLNIRKNEETEGKLLELVKYWRRAKALKKWLELAD